MSVPELIPQPAAAFAIAAVMVPVPDVELALAWYQRAFPGAIRSRVDGFDFEYLALGEIRLELVRADEKVTAGPSGSVVYWHVHDFDQALQDIQDAGAVLHRGPMTIEHGQRMCQVRDPWGNCIGLRGPNRLPKPPEAR